MGIKKKLNTPENNRTVTIIISILIAFFLWIYVIGEVNPVIKQTIPNISVQLLNEESLNDRGLAISGDKEYTVDVIIEGKRSDITKLKGKEITAEVDLFGWNKGENFIPVHVQIPDSLSIVEVKPSKIQVNIDDLVSINKPVIVIFSGEIPQGYEESEVEIKPAEIEVTGAKTDVRKVNQVQATVDVDKLSEDKKSIKAKAMAVNYLGTYVENVELSSDHVKVSARLSELKEVDLKLGIVGVPDDDFDIVMDYPEKIFIKGAKDAIKDITSVSTKPIDITGIKSNETAPISVILPDGVEKAKGYEKLTLKINTMKIGSKTFGFTSEDISVEGLAKGKNVNMDMSNFEVIVSGKKEILSELTNDKLKLYIDVTDAPLGQMKRKILVRSTLSLQKISIKPEEINITIEEVD